MIDINYDNYYWENSQVRLRAMEPNDWEEQYINMFDSNARRLLQAEIELPPTIKNQKEKTERFSYFNTESGGLMFTVENKEGKNVGGAYLNSINEKNGTFSIGIQIGQRYRRNGYGTAAMRILLNYAFFERRLNKFNTEILKGNIASEKMLKKIGCLNEGVRKEQIYTNGKYQDVILFGLTKINYLKICEQ
ncbi:MAG: GNAT family N-acetyltransferase [Bacteroidales bacterium]|nr:GNAT family N-acetyltransferase [Bacteroidales bacterium]